MRNEADVIPKGTKWIKDAVVSIDPGKNAVLGKSGKLMSMMYWWFVRVFKIDWQKIGD